MADLDPRDPSILEYEQSFLRLNPESLERDLVFVAEAVETELHFEPFKAVGDVDGLLRTAANLAMFAEEYRNRTGSLRLPDKS